MLRSQTSLYDALYKLSGQVFVFFSLHNITTNAMAKKVLPLSPPFFFGWVVFCFINRNVHQAIRPVEIDREHIKSHAN